MQWMCPNTVMKQQWYRFAPEMVSSVPEYDAHASLPLLPGSNIHHNHTAFSVQHRKPLLLQSLNHSKVMLPEISKTCISFKKRMTATVLMCSCPHAITRASRSSRYNSRFREVFDGSGEPFVVDTINFGLSCSCISGLYRQCF